MTKKQIYFPEQQLQQLERLIQQTGISLAEHVRQAVREYLEKPENQVLGTSQKK